MVLQFGLDRSSMAPRAMSQAAINAARVICPTSLRSKPTYRKINPADCADHDLGDDIRNDDAGSAIRSGVQRPPTAALSRFRVLGKSTWAEARCRRSASTQSAAALFKYGIGLGGRARGACFGQCQRPKGAIDAGSDTIRSIPTTRPRRSAIPRPGHRLSQRRRR